MKKDIIIYGAGGQAECVINAVEKESKYEIVGLIDDINPSGPKILGYKVLGNKSILPSLLKSDIKYCIIAIGDNKIREEKAKLIKEIGFDLISVRDPFSSIGKNVSIGKGTTIFHGASIDPNISIGKGVIVNTNSTIGHGSKINDFSHISGGAICGSYITLEKYCFIGMGAIIFPHLKIGKNTVIGAGTFVRKNLPDNVIVYGRPAKIVRKNEK